MTRNSLASFYTDQSLRPYNTCKRLDHCSFFIRDTGWKKVSSAIHIDLRYPDKFTESTGVVITFMQRFTGGMISQKAVFAFVAWNMMAYENPLTHFEFNQTLIQLFRLSFHGQVPAGFLYPVPFHQVSPANT